MTHPARCPVCDGAARAWCILKATDIVWEMLCAACFLWAMRQTLQISKRRSA